MKNAEYHVDGCVDLVDQTRIQGWVICKKLLSKRANISVFLNGDKVASGPANIQRNDLLSVGIGVANFSFTLPFRTSLNQSDLPKLRVIASFQVDDAPSFESEVMFLPSILNRMMSQGKSSSNTANKHIKTVYYITGPTSSGKTTAGIRLSKELGLPIFHADLVYNMLKDKYEISGPAERLLANELWNDPLNFGISSWGSHHHINDAKVELFKVLLGDAKGDFIIEGFSLSISSEREIVKNVVGAHRAIILRIDMPYQEWSELFRKKTKINISEAHFSEYERLRSYFSDNGAFKVAEFDHPEKVTAESVENIPVLIKSECLEFITHEDFINQGQQHLENNPLDKDGNYVGYWKDLEDRWAYHKRVIDIIRQSGKSYFSALELGSMGISVIKNGHTIDYDKHISYYSDLQPHYIHDVRNLPWPIQDNYYEWFIALRVFHHLAPVQRQCFDEARRVAKNVILVVPKELPPGGGYPISPEDFVVWGNGVAPTIVEDVGRFGMLYAWLEL